MSLDPKINLLAKRPATLREGGVSIGATLLNLACSDEPDFGFLPGGYYFLVGDSTSGKTWLSLTCFAEATLNANFKDYDLILDDVEGGALMDIEFYFGKHVARRMRSPSTYKGKPRNSDTVESFYYHLWDLTKAGKKFIYVLDSQDALTSDSSAKKFEKQKKANEEKEEAAGSMGDGKAKYHSEHLRQIISEIRKMGSILIIIGQTRDNLGMGFDPKTRSGGKALRFYANLEIWTSLLGKIKKTVRGKERTVGTKILAEVRKNRLTGKTGKDRAVTISILNGVGIDDVGSCVDFLTSELHWPKIKADKEEKEKCRNIYDAHDIFVQGSREKIVQYIEEEGLEAKLRKITAKVWHQIEEECQVIRKRRYE